MIKHILVASCIFTTFFLSDLANADFFPGAACHSNSTKSIRSNGAYYNNAYGEVTVYCPLGRPTDNTTVLAVSLRYTKLVYNCVMVQIDEDGKTKTFEPTAVYKPSGSTPGEVRWDNWYPANDTMLRCSVPTYSSVIRYGA